MSFEERPNALRQWVKQGMMSALPPWAFLARGPEDSRAVCLTFDDGPHPEHTPVLLDALRAEGVQATFFVVGKRARAHPDIVRRMAAEGHAVGHHSYTHAEPSQQSALGLGAEARETSKLLERILGERPRLFRPPHGKLTAGKLATLWAARQTVVLWNVDPRDYLAESAEALVEFFRGNPLRGGDIVLLHDTHPHAAGAMAWIAEQARAAGLELTTAMRFTEHSRETCQNAIA